MRRFPLGLFAISAVAVFAACSGPAGNGLPGTPGSTALFRGLEPAKAAAGPRIGHVYDALTFDGTTFAIDSHRSCGHRGLGGIPGYTAPASGALTLGSSPSLTPACAASAAPTTQLYIFAIPLKTHGSAGGGPHWNGIEIAGPVNAGDNPWVFAPLSPGLTANAGSRYAFVIATAFQHPTPAPSSTPTTAP